MKQTFTYRQKAREMLIVLLPIFITQLALMSTGFFDTIMAGHVSEQLASIFFIRFGAAAWESFPGLRQSWRIFMERENMKRLRSLSSRAFTGRWFWQGCSLCWG